MRFGSLFTGIGGLDLGLERAGMECAWQVELDPYCRSVLEKHWPDVPRWDDVKTFCADADPMRKLQQEGGEQEKWGWARNVDLICGGFPCQPVSVAGKQAARNDARWLWPEFARILRVLRPRYVLLENVPGLLGSHGGFGDVLGDLAALGYDAEWDCVPAALFGAPHLRYRVFVVAYARCEHDVANTDAERRDGRPRIFREGWWRELADCGQWQSEPDMGRVAHGVPARVHRLRALGNAVVPQVAEAIGRAITARERGEER